MEKRFITSGPGCVTSSILSAFSTYNFLACLGEITVLVECTYLVCKKRRKATSFVSAEAHIVLLFQHSGLVGPL